MNKFVKKMISTVISCLIVLVTLVNTSIKINAFTPDIDVFLFGTENSLNDRTFLSEQFRNLSRELKQTKITVFDNMSADLTEAKSCLYVMCIDLNDENFETLTANYFELLNRLNPLPTMAIFWITGFNNCKSEDPNDVLSRIYDILNSRQVPSQCIFVPHATTNPAKIDAVLFTKNETNEAMHINLQSCLLNITYDTITRFTNLHLHKLNQRPETLTNTSENARIMEVYSATVNEFAGLQLKYLNAEVQSLKDALATEKSTAEENLRLFNDIKNELDAQRKTIKEEGLPKFDGAVKTLQNSQILQTCSDLETKAENIQDQLEQAERIFNGNLDATGLNSIKLTENIQHPTDEQTPGLKNVKTKTKKSTLSNHKSQLPNVITSIVKDNVEELIGSRNVIKPSSEPIDNPPTILNSLGKSSKSNSAYKKLGLGTLITIPIGIIVAFAKNLYTKLKKPDINKQEITHKHELTIKLDLDTAKTSSLQI